MKKQKKILLITVIVTAVAIGIVYAAFTALTLRVNTSATASASIFSVGFDDVAPTIFSNTIRIWFNSISYIKCIS